MGLQARGRGQRAPEKPARHKEQTALPCARPQHFRSPSSDPGSHTAGPVCLGGEKEESGAKRVAAASSGAQWLGATRQPSPQIEDQADSQDDAQEEDEGQPGLHEGPDADGGRAAG